MPKFPLTKQAALRRLRDVRKGGKGGRVRNPAIDLAKRAVRVAPLGKSPEAIRLQQAWWASPGTMDLQGVDTPGARTRQTSRSRTTKRTTAKRTTAKGKGKGRVSRSAGRTRRQSRARGQKR